MRVLFSNNTPGFFIFFPMKSSQIRGQDVKKTIIKEWESLFKTPTSISNKEEGIYDPEALTQETCLQLFIQPLATITKHDDSRIRKFNKTGK